ncbi:phosphopantetheine-binding protein [Actinomadura meridiana]
MAGIRDEPGTEWDEKFGEIVARHLPLKSDEDGIDPSLDMRSSGLDSIEAIYLLLDLEEEYSLSFPEELLSMEVFATPSSLWEAVSSMRAADGNIQVSEG